MAQLLAFGGLISLARFPRMTVFFSRAKGISLPFFLQPKWGFRTERQWSDLLRSVTYKARNKGGVLRLYFKDGKRVDFDSGFSKLKISNK